MDGLVVENLSHSWKNFSLNDVQLSVEKGEYFVLLGPTGSGKTLLLEAIVGAYQPRNGRIIVEGEDVTNLPPERRKISYAPQNCLLFTNMKVRENVEYGLYAKGIPSDERRKTAERVMQLLGISHLAQRDTKTLSGGEQQRVSLARALAVQPKLILLDEPLSAVDSETKRTVLEELRRIHEQTGVTKIHVTHDIWEAASLAGVIGVINAGKILQVGAPDVVLREPTKNYPSVENIFKGLVVRRTSDLAEIDIGDNILLDAITERSGEVTLQIRPEDLIVSSRAVSSSARNDFTGTIAEITDLGATVRLRIDGGKTFTAVITRQSFFEMQLNIGTPVHAICKATSVHVL